MSRIENFIAAINECFLEGEKLQELKALWPEMSTSPLVPNWLKMVLVKYKCVKKPVSKDKTSVCVIFLALSLKKRILVISS